MKRIVSAIITLSSAFLAVLVRRSKLPKVVVTSLVGLLLITGGFFAIDAVRRDVSAAEVTIEGNAYDVTDQLTQGPTVVFTTDQIGYFFYTDSANGIVYRKTTNGGTSWGSPVDVTTTATLKVSVWYDQWTPGDTSGTKIYITWLDSLSDCADFRVLDTSDDTFDAAEVCVLDHVTNVGTTGADPGPFVMKATDDDLFLISVAGSSNFDVASSTDNGVNWGEEGVSFLNASEAPMLAPLSGGDVVYISYDNTIGSLISREYDDSAATSFAGSDTTIASSLNCVDGGIGDPLVDYTQNLSDYTVYLACTSNNADNLVTYSYSGGSWSTKTNIISTAALMDVSLSLDSNTGDIYAVYTYDNAAGDVFYKKSTDGMTNWGSETQVSTTNDDLRNVETNHVSDERIYAVYSNDDLDDYLGETVVDLTPSGGGGGGKVQYQDVIWFD